jgi:hypothetical protein
MYLDDSGLSATNVRLYLSIGFYQQLSIWLCHTSASFLLSINHYSFSLYSIYQFVSYITFDSFFCIQMDDGLTLNVEENAFLLCN